MGGNSTKRKLQSIEIMETGKRLAGYVEPMSRLLVRVWKTGFSYPRRQAVLKATENHSSFEANRVK